MGDNVTVTTRAKSTTRIKELVGGSLSLITGLAIAGMAAAYLFSEYFVILKGFFETKRIGGVIMQSLYQPVFAQIVWLGAAFLVVGAYGFFISRSWAWLTALIGATIGIFGGFMLMMFPLMVWLPMRHIPTFVLSAITWVVLVVYVRPHGWQLVAFSFTCGMASVMTFMNGNAALNKIFGAHYNMSMQVPDQAHVGMIKMASGNNPALLYQGIQQILWISCIGLFVVTIASLYRKSWVLPLGIGASLVSLVAGTPVAYIDTTVDKAGESLSMFSFAPFLAAVILIWLLVFREKIWTPKSAKAQEAAVDVAA